jgi:hypothetical protein
MSKMSQYPICDPSKYYGESPVGEDCVYYKDGRCTTSKKCFCKIGVVKYE